MHELQMLTVVMIKMCTNANRSSAMIPDVAGFPQPDLLR